MPQAPSPQGLFDSISNEEFVTILRALPYPSAHEAASRIEYLAAQEGMLEGAQSVAAQLRSELARTRQPLTEEVQRLNQRIEQLNGLIARQNAALSWYGEEAAAIARNLAIHRETAVAASLQVLALDAGKRSKVS